VRQGFTDFQQFIATNQSLQLLQKQSYRLEEQRHPQVKDTRYKLGSRKVSREYVLGGLHIN